MNVRACACCAEVTAGLRPEACLSSLRDCTHTPTPELQFVEEDELQQSMSGVRKEALFAPVQAALCIPAAVSGN